MNTQVCESSVHECACVICTWMCTCTRTYKYTHNTPAYTYACMYVWIWTPTYTYMHLHMDICIQIHMHAGIHIFTYTHTCMHGRHMHACMYVCLFALAEPIKNDNNMNIIYMYVCMSTFSHSLSFERASLFPGSICHLHTWYMLYIYIYIIYIYIYIYISNLYNRNESH